jgi:hypothetical protein
MQNREAARLEEKRAEKIEAKYLKEEAVRQARMKEFLAADGDENGLSAQQKMDYVNRCKFAGGKEKPQDVANSSKGLVSRRRLYDWWQQMREIERVDGEKTLRAHGRPRMMDRQQVATLASEILSEAKKGKGLRGRLKRHSKGKETAPSLNTLVMNSGVAMSKSTRTRTKRELRMLINSNKRKKANVTTLTRWKAERDSRCFHDTVNRNYAANAAVGYVATHHLDTGQMLPTRCIGEMDPVKCDSLLAFMTLLNKSLLLCYVTLCGPSGPREKIPTGGRPMTSGPLPNSARCWSPAQSG